MRTKRVISTLLAACMLLSLMPAITLPIYAESNPDPTYTRVGTPEVAIFNAYTGASADFFKSQMANHFYNAVAAGVFKRTDDSTSLLNYEVKVSKNSTYVWDSFYNSNLAYLSDRYQQLQAGYAVTRTSNSHTHRWQLFYSADLTSYMNTDLYLADLTNNQYWDVADYRGFSRSASTLREGNGVFHPLGYTINGANSRYMIISGVNQSAIRKSMYISFVDSTLYYDGQKRTCTCGGSATGAMVSFYDGTAPTVRSVEIKNGDAASTNFKAGDTVTVVLNCSEAIRFADDSASGKGNVYIGLTVEGSTDRLHANLTSLDGEALTFTYQVPSNDTKLYTITGIDLTSAPNGGTALVHTSPDIILKQVYGGSGNKTYTANRPASVSSELGFTKTTSQVTDMAGNALVNSVPATSFYIDCEDPYVAVAGLIANTNNGDVKAVLGKTDMAPNSANYEDNSDLYLGVGDSFSLTLYMNEVVTGANATITTNIKRSDNSYLTLDVTSSGTTAASGIGSQYGKGASMGQLSVLYTDPVTITAGMTVDGTDGIKITGVAFTDVKDASGNSAVSTAKSPDKKTYIDTAGPVIEAQAAVQTNGVNNSFYLPFVVTDAASGVASLPASLTVKSGDSTSAFQYAVTASAGTPDQWSDGTFGISIPFTQTGAQQYLHIKPVDGETYNFSGNAAVTFNLADYAGNTGISTVTLDGVSMDTVPPTATAGDSIRSYDNSANHGTLTAAIHASDQGGLASVQYQWNNDTALTTDSEGWVNAVGSLDNNPASAELTASATVASGDAFRQLLWVKVTDVAGNSSVTNLGEYSYSLQGIKYILDYSPAIRTSASIKVSSLDADGKLIFDVRKAGTDTHYITVADSTGENDIFSGTWYTAAFSDASGYSFTDLVLADDFLSGFTGNLYVTVYSGNGETIAQAADTITATTNAGVESFTLRVSPSGNAAGDVFSGSRLLSADANTLSAITACVSAYPWSYGYGNGVSSTLEGVQLSIDLGDDKNGWDYTDIDWQSSFIALYSASAAAPGTLQSLQAAKLCGIGSGPSQMVTLPAYDYVSGYFNLALVLVRNSDPASFYTAVMKNGEENARICIDVTEPGSLALGVMAKEGRLYTGSYEGISYDPDAPIYIPTESYDVTLSMEALDAAGNPVDFSGANGAYINAGAMDIIAWNTAAPETKVSLSHAHLTNDEGYIFRDQEYDSYPSGGKRLLHFGETTAGVVSGFPSGVLGVTADQDNIIALQIQYANGRASAVTYLTIHPVTLILTGTVATSPTVDESTYGPFNPYTTSGLVSADPGAASIVFTPDSGSNTTGLTLYCQEGFSSESGGYFMPDGYGEQVYEMTLQSDGTYTWQVPSADAEAYASAFAAYAEDWENNPHPGRYIGIFEPTDAYLDDTSIVPSGYYNIIRDGGQPAGYYVVYATDRYGNMQIIGITKNAVIADASAPVISGESITTADGGYTATFRIYDDSLFSFGRDSDWNDKAISRPMTLTLSYDDDYASAIGASGESLTLTADASSEAYTWKADSGNQLGIYEVEAVLTRSGEFKGSTTYYNGAEDVYLTVTVKGIVSPAITSATNMTLNMTATDAHGNKAQQTGLTAGVTGAAPQVTAMEFKAIEMTPGISDLALFVTFNLPVQPNESWINRNISGYATEWQDSFPITNDGTWDITFTDVFGTVYTTSVNTDDYKGSKDSVFGVYGFDLDFSTLDYVQASQGVVITASYTGTDGSSLHIYKGSDNITTGDEVNRLVGRTATADTNGEYVIYLYGDSGWTDKTHVCLNNIVSGGPEETLYFFVDEFKEQYTAGASDQFRGTTTGSVTVSYKTSRETSPVGNTTLTFKNGDNDSFSFQYYDVPTDFTYTITGRLIDYGITLAAPETPYEDTEAPTIDLVTVWTQKGSGFVQTEAFPGSADESGIRSAIANSGTAQSYDFVVNASDYSKWKVVVKSAAPTSMRYATAASDTIPGVSVSGNNVLVTKEIASDFYIVVVDNAAADSAATADNFICIRIPNGSYHFDTTAPVIETITVADSLYSKTVYIRVTDRDDEGNDTSSGVTVTGAGVAKETNTVNGTTYTHKLAFADNDTVVVVTATDAAGNSATVNIQVTGIDVTAPNLAVTWSPCFKDPTTGRLDQSNPTAGPVNTDVVAHIASDKEIARVRVNGNVILDPEHPLLTDWSGNTVVSYTSQRITVFFTDESEASYQLEVFAPNGKSTTTAVSLNAGVIDKTPPFVEDLWTSSDVEDYVAIEELKRPGFDTAYAIRISLADPYEDVFCMDSGTAGIVYNQSYPFIVTLTENEELAYLFADKAGNLQRITIPAPATDDLDSVAPEIELPNLDDDVHITSGNVAIAVKVYDETGVTLTSSSDGVTCGLLTKSTENGRTVWIGNVTVTKNGTFRLTATDSAGNTSQLTFTVNNIDRTLPVISFDTSTVSLRQDSESTALAALLAVDSGSVHAWDNVEIKEGTLKYDASNVRLDTPGIYPVTYTVEDTAGNIGQAVRYVKVIDKNQPVITVDGILTEQNGVTSIRAGTHILSVSGLQTANEPYTLKLIKGIWSSGQMKRASGGIAVAADGSFTVTATGFYTLYITTQSRQTYRTLLYVEN